MVLRHVLSLSLGVNQFDLSTDLSYRDVPMNWQDVAAGLTMQLPLHLDRRTQNNPSLHEPASGDQSSS